MSEAGFDGGDNIYKKIKSGGLVTHEILIFLDLLETPVFD